MTREVPVIFGEVLFDRFPDGEAVLGGAPFNVAWHLQAFDHQPLFISRVGDDAEGEAVLERMRAHGMRIDGVQRDAEHPTGTVTVALDDGQPRYTIESEQAYDYIDASEIELPNAAPVFYHGTLALRGKRSGASFAAIVEEAADRRFVDVNLRSPWWDREAVRQHLQGAHWVKLNQDELVQLGDEGEAPMALRAENFRQSLSIDRLVVTIGAEGALFFDEGAPGPLLVRPSLEVEVVDTVGAGDAFATVLLMSMLRGWSLPLALERAQEFAAAVCTLRGATVDDPEFYAGFAGSWSHT